MKLLIGETAYPLKSVEELSLLDILTLERETRELGRPLTMSVISAMEKDVDQATRGLKTAEERSRARQDHPESPWLLAVMLWASRRAAGEKVTFEEAISFPLAQLSFLREEGDPEGPDVQDPTTARPGSGRAAKPPAKRSSTKTSSKQSSHA